MKLVQPMINGTNQVDGHDSDDSERKVKIRKRKLDYL